MIVLTATIGSACADSQTPAAAPDLHGPISAPSSLSASASMISHPEIAPFAKGQTIYLRAHREETAPSQPFTLYQAALYAEKHYPKILQEQAQVQAAKKQVSVQKIKEYLPYSLMSYQQVVATHNKLTQTLFGTPALPANPGPGLDSVKMGPQFFSGTGFILDWAPIDFGLHKARIQESKAQWKLAEADYSVTQLDVAVQACSTFLLVVVMEEQVKAAEANVGRFSGFSRVVHSLVDADLRPAADASLADAQLANARNDLIRANLQAELARADFANSLGLGGQNIGIDPRPIATVSEPADMQPSFPNFELHPLALRGKASILTEVTHKRVLDKEYYPVLRWLGGMNFRGSSLNVKGYPQSQNAFGFAPAQPNYNVGVMIDFPFLDIVRIQAEKKVTTQNIEAQRQAYGLILQNLKTQNVQAQARVKAAVALAANMPVQVQAALSASRQAQARYEAGLATVAQVAEANQVLADSRVKEAVARIGVWQALLAVAANHGDLKPFLDEAIRLQQQRIQ